MSLSLPPVPAALRPIQHYLKTGSEHEGRDPVVTYWCRLFALQTALKLDKKSEESKALLIALMDWLEQQKKAMSENEAITNDLAAQAHIENYALKLFHWADAQDRAGNFNKNVVKAFYTAAMLMEVLTTFGELNEEVAGQCKYAKWKAAYIHNCLKNGETPIPGPAAGEERDNLFPDNTASNNPTVPIGGGSSEPEAAIGFAPFSHPPSIPPIEPLPPQPPYTPKQDEYVGGFEARPSHPDVRGGAIKLEPSQITKAQKYCKFAASALNYDDVNEAISNLQKALHLLQTGDDS